MLSVARRPTRHAPARGALIAARTAALIADLEAGLIAHTAPDLDPVATQGHLDTLLDHLQEG